MLDDTPALPYPLEIRFFRDAVLKDGSIRWKVSLWDRVNCESMDCMDFVGTPYLSVLSREVWANALRIVLAESGAI